MTFDPDHVRARFERCAYAAQHGMQIVDLETGMARVRFEVPAWALNSLGVCHGGAIFTLADYTQAVANHTIGTEVGMQGNVNWLTSAREGDVLTAEGRVLHAGRRTFVVSVEVQNQRGRRIAQATFTAARLDDPEPTAQA